ncbi:MAG: hypothetical protein MUD08_15915 [Cytophagales bacterium]|jgi:antitoxin component YwqK of YwqJK toxin-antitoxin module|nr:hypothetical protein [Cytophagales bacterium]
MVSTCKNLVCRTAACLLVAGCLLMLPAAAQEVADDSLMREDDPEAMLLVELAQAKKKKTDEKVPLKQPKNMFYGTKIKRNFIKQFTTNGTDVEIFHYVLDPQAANPYLQNVQEVVWFNPNKRALEKSLGADKEDMRLLHGPYKKMRNGKVIAEGFYYMGGRHGRWEEYDEDYVLKNKTKYYHGWPKEAEITYYDSERKKMKEVICVHYGEKHGNYYAFYEGGQLMARGRYEHNHPVGAWYEYHQHGKYSMRKKKETRYPRRAFDSTPPVVVREWDDKGKLLYDLDRDGEKPVEKTARKPKTEETEEESGEKF